MILGPWNYGKRNTFGRIECPPFLDTNSTALGSGHVFFFVASAPSRFNREAFASSLPFYVNTSSGGRIRRQYGYTKLEEPVPARSLMLSNLGHG